jgi:hypothetical protein
MAGENDDQGVHERIYIQEELQHPYSTYVSGLARTMEETQELVASLESLGHNVTLDWTPLDVQKPYLDHVEHNRAIAQQMIEAVRRANVFILLWSPNVHGALAEYGGFLFRESPHVLRRAYIVGEKERQSIFDTLPEVRFCETTDELLEDLSK